MTSSPKSITDLEQLVKSRDKLLKTISDLELGLHNEKKKMMDYQFHLNDKKTEFDIASLKEQIDRSKINVEQIKNILAVEKQKLAEHESLIASSKTVVQAHGVEPCLTGSIPHEWEIISKHRSGKFSKRKCRKCGTTERVGSS